MRGNDPSESLRNLARLDVTKWEPKLTTLRKTDVDENLREYTQNEMKQKMGCDACLKRERTFYEN